MINQDRSDRWIAVLVALGFHVLLIFVVIRVAATRRTPSPMPHDAPAAADDFLADARPVSGTTPQQAPLPHFVRCNYALLADVRDVTLVEGPVQKPGRLGCSTTLSLASPVDPVEIRIEYDQQGQIVEIKGARNF